MDFEAATKQFNRLKRLLQAGKIDQAEFVRGVDNLAIEDEQGVEWQIGMRSGLWYRKEGEKWIESDPVGPLHPISQTPKRRLDKKISNKKNRRLVLVGLLTLLLVLLLLSPRLFSSGQLLNLGDQGLSSLNKTSNGLGTSQSGVGQPAQGDQEPEFLSPEVNEMVPTITSTGQPTVYMGASSPTDQPTSEPTLPPPPAKRPQIWEERSSLSLDGGVIQGVGWDNLLEQLWEYEILEYKGKQALLLQYNQEVALSHSDQQGFEDVERSITLALPNERGDIALTCRWQPDSQAGYGLRLSHNLWEIIKYENGLGIVLTSGNQQEDFQRGEYESFRLNCTNGVVTAWAGQHLLATISDDDYSQGAVSLLFGVDSGVALVFIADDRVLVRVNDDSSGSFNSIVRLGSVDVQYLANLREYTQMTTNPNSGQSLIALTLRIANHGEESLSIDSENIYLQKGNQRIYAQKPPSQVGSEVSSFPLPTNLTSDEITGEIYFTGVNLVQLRDWELVVSFEGFSAVKFNIGE